MQRPKDYNYKYEWLLIWVVIVLATNSVIKLGGMDDSLNIETIENTFNGNVLEWVSFRYNSWSARFVNEAIGFVLIQNALLWKAVNSIIMIMTPLLFDYLGRTRSGIAAFLFMCIPLSYISEVGWISTTTGYLFIAFFALCALALIRCYVDNKGDLTRTQELLLSFGIVITVILGASHELLSMLVLISIAYASYMYKKEYGSYSLILLISALLVIIEVAIILYAPGNASRMLMETSIRFPEFSSFTIIEKVLLGILRVFEVCVIEKNALFCIYIVIIAVGGFIVGNTTVQKVIATIPLVIVFIFVFIWDDFTYTEPMAKVLTFKNICLIVVSFVILIGSAIGLWAIITSNAGDNLGKSRGLFAVILEITGIGTQAAMGFSPTIYASGYRTSLFMQFVFIYLILVVGKVLAQSIAKTIPYRAIKLFECITLILCGIVYIYIASKIQY